MPDFPDRAELEFELESALCMPLIATKGYAAPETGDALARAHELGVQLKRTDQLFPVLYGQWAYYVVGGENPTGRQRAQEFLSLAEGQVDPDLELVGHRMLGMPLLHLGNLGAAQAQFEEALAFYDPKRHRALAFRYGQDQGASALSFLSLILWLAGFPDRASREVNRCDAGAASSRRAGGSRLCGRGDILTRRARPELVAGVGKDLPRVGVGRTGTAKGGDSGDSSSRPSVAITCWRMRPPSRRARTI
jgi:hypothetical protein